MVCRPRSGLRTEPQTDRQTDRQREHYGLINKQWLFTEMVEGLIGAIRNDGLIRYPNDVTGLIHPGCKALMTNPGKGRGCQGWSGSDILKKILATFCQPSTPLNAHH